MGDIKGFEVSDVLGLGKGMVKLLDVIESTFGKPLATFLNGKAKASEFKSIIKVMSENSEEQLKYDDGIITIDMMDSSEIKERAMVRFVTEQIIKQTNLEEVLKQALIHVSEDENEVNDEPVDQDWFSRFTAIAENISDTNMRDLWSKILAGEVKRPGSLSLRTLDIIKNISQDEAIMFVEILPYVFHSNNDTSFIYNLEDILIQNNITYRKLLILQECGLLNLSSAILKFDVDFKIGIYNRMYFAEIIEKNKNLKNYGFPIIKLTEAGREIFTISDNINYNEEKVLLYVKEMLKAIKNISNSRDIQLSRVIRVSDDKIECSNNLIDIES